MKRNIEIADNLIVKPIRSFMSKSSSSGIILFGAAIIALFLANSPWKDWYHALWEGHFKIGFDNFMIDKDLKHWINDGLMAVFFFVVGLELKREIIAGELSDLKNAVLPIIAAVGGMLFPALIYLFINSQGEASNGWGVPMATDIAFALGVLFLLGKRVPVSLKIFLTALAIVDDIGAVLVIAFFYTSNINVDSLILGVVFFCILLTANLTGVRNVLFYALIGIGGLWIAFLMSGVHATIAAVVAAFTIPVTGKLSNVTFGEKMKIKLQEFVKTDESMILKPEQIHVLSSMNKGIKKTISPLQRLEHALHPFVSFVVMPIFAFANAGVTIDGNFLKLLTEPITLGVMLGLLVGKMIGVVGTAFALHGLGIAKIPKGLNRGHIWGAGMLAAIGFTMSLFVTSLAFHNPEYAVQAKLGVLLVSMIASILGYFTIRHACKKA